MGKTAFGLGIATHVAETAQKPVLVFSLEMGHAELTQRILSSEAEVDSQKLRTGRLVDSRLDQDRPGDQPPRRSRCTSTTTRASR